MLNPSGLATVSVHLTLGLGRRAPLLHVQLDTAVGAAVTRQWVEGTSGFGASVRELLCPSGAGAVVSVHMHMASGVHQHHDGVTCHLQHATSCCVDVVVEAGLYPPAGPAQCFEDSRNKSVVVQGMCRTTLGMYSLAAAACAGSQWVDQSQHASGLHTVLQIALDAAA